MAFGKKAVSKKKVAAKTKGNTRAKRGGGDWEEELEREAAKDAEREGKHAGGGSYGVNVSTKGGVLSIGGEEVKGNEIEVVIVDYVFENAYYDGPYNPTEPRPPACYAIGREEEELAPSEKAEDPQADACEGCELNEWGSAETGRGKACKNTRRLALWLPGDEEDEDELPELGRMNIPVTSVKEFAKYLKELGDEVKKPHWAVVTLIKLVPNRQSQYKVEFEFVEVLDKDSIEKVKELRDGPSEELLMQEYPSSEQMESRRKQRDDNRGGKKRSGRRDRDADEDEKPAAKKRGSRKAAKEEEDEEDDAPKRRTRRKF